VQWQTLWWIAVPPLYQIVHMHYILADGNAGRFTQRPTSCAAFRATTQCHGFPSFAGLPELPEKVLEASRSHQRSEQAESFAVAMAWILERVVLGSTAEEAIREALEMRNDSGFWGTRGRSRHALSKDALVALRQSASSKHGSRQEVVSVRSLVLLVNKI
jgi:hypothetical protein